MTDRPQLFNGMPHAEHYWQEPSRVAGLVTGRCARRESNPDPLLKRKLLCRLSYGRLK